MDPRVKAFIINLDRAPDRWSFMQAQMAGARIEAERIAAHDAKAPGFTPRGGLSLTRDDVLIETNWDGRAYVMGEEACFQSHLKALAAFLDSGAAIGLIFEDDAELAPDFTATVDAILAHQPLWDFVKLEGVRRKGGRPAIRLAQAGAYELIASFNPTSGAAAYLVTRAAAERLLALADGVFEPFDNFLSAHWRHGLKSLDCAPFPARQGLPVSTRLETRGPTTRGPMEKFTAWRRHIAADFWGRYVRRWAGQIGRFGLKGRWTITPWARDEWRA